MRSQPDGKLSYPAAPVPIPNAGTVRLKLEVRGPAAAVLLRARGRRLGADRPGARRLDCSRTSAGPHGEHGSFTGAFVGMAASDLNGTARQAVFSDFVYRPVRDPSDRY